ncbi:hypothetical protein [Pseudarthrobacter oxydans]|uniref:hypothetical protein n=1 Tax=Pseudarthrobacter oxydans TaxID=1671 RepID=UPI0038211485
MATTTYKMPESVLAFANLADDLGMKAHELMGQLEQTFGSDSLLHVSAFSVTTLGVQDSGEVIAPAGYVLAEGVTDTYVGAETVSSAFIIRPSWHAATGLFSIEVTPADGTGDYQALAPEEALKLAADLTAAAEGIRPVNITAAVPASV